MKLSRAFPWSWALLAIVTVGAAWRWHGGGPDRTSMDKAVPTAADRAAAEAESPTTLIVDYRDDVSDSFLAATPEDEQPVSRWSATDRIYRVAFASREAAAAAIARLGSDPRVESIDRDVQATIPPDEQAAESAAADDDTMQAECGKTAGDGSASDDGGGTKFPSDPCYHYQWHLRQIGLPDAWKLGQGKGAVVAVIDTGVSRVPDLAGATFVPGYNFVADNDNAADDHGHGTHVAGTIAQTTNNRLGVGGVAFQASIMPLKVLSASGSGSMAGIAQAIRYAADHGAHVINMSLGGGFPVATIGTAVTYARSKGVTVIAAAGNNGRGSVSYPARYPGVIAVAATQFNETTTFYSNWGKQIDIAAPGGNTRVDENGDGKPDGVLQNTVVPGNVSRTSYLWFMGTSMASPHVAGVAALVVGAGVTKPDAVEEILLGTARKPRRGSDARAAAVGGTTASNATAGRIDDHYGAGLVDAHAALHKVRSGRGAGELGLGAAAALVGLSFLARRGRAAGGRLGLGFGAALVAGSSGLFFLAGGGALGALSHGLLGGTAALLGPAWSGNPLLWSALIPLGLTALLYGVGRLRPALAGLGFGVAGALLFAAIAGAFDVRYVPDLLDRAWLLANAAVAAVFATNVLRR